MTYLATFPGTEDAIPPNPRSQDHGTGLEWDPLYLSQTLPWKARPGATWSMNTPDYGGEEYKRLARMAGPGKKLFLSVLATRKNPETIEMGLHHFSGLPKEILPFAKKVCRDTDLPLKCRVWAFPILGQCDETDFLPDMAAVQEDKTWVTGFTSRPKGAVGEIDYTIEVRDIAVAVQLLLHKQSLADYGFVRAASVKPDQRQIPTWQFNTIYHAFPDADSRKAAHDKALAFLKTAPVPKAKPTLPKKLERAPDPSPELQKELSQLDKDYRHGTPEQFAELEKTADELARQFTEKDDQARIWHEVAHVAAQSRIDKHAERVKKYAAKCLVISRDPIQRATLYSYLASAEEVSGGAFAERRRTAADWLLMGYLELLAQELPDEKPELPNAPRVLGDNPANRARNAAVMAAIVETRFVQEQVFRRDVLVQQLRDLYKPDAKRAGRDEKGPDEL
ncbi:MAG: hypothetical protein ABGY75_13445, partial [Gemmataceae bacterium]